GADRQAGRSDLAPGVRAALREGPGQGRNPSRRRDQKAAGRVGAPGVTKEVGMRVVMMGTGLFAEPTFEALLGSGHEVAGLVTQPDGVVGAERGSTRQTGKGMKTIAQAAGVPVFQPESINTPEGIAGLREMRPELLVVAAYGQILKREVLEAAPRGGINVH